MMTVKAKRPPVPHRNAGRPDPGGQQAKATRGRSRKAALSQLDIAELAEEMHIPEGTLHLVLQRYPELARPLARHRALVA
jgi:hypothetical protein